MERELTSAQAREIMRLRRRHADADVVVHPEPWGLIVEARRAGRTLELAGLDWAGRVRPERRIGRRARRAA